MSNWIGHSITVSGRHYANDVPEEVFRRVTQPEERGAQRQAQRKVQASPGNEQKRKKTAAGGDDLISGDCSGLPGYSVKRGNAEQWSRGDLNPRVETVGRKLLRV